MSMEKNKRHSQHDFRKLVYRDGSFDCQGCKERHFGFRYECKEICRSDFCESCSVEHRKPIRFYVPQKKQRMVFEWKKEAPLDSGNRYCIACGRNVRGFHYESKAKKHSSKNHVLHPTCAHVPDKIKARGVEFRLVDKTNSKCIACSHVQHPTYNKSSVYELDKVRGGCVHVVCIRRSIEKGWSRLQTELLIAQGGSRLQTEAASWHKYSEIVGALLEVIIGAIVGGAIGGLLVPLVVKLLSHLFKSRT